MEDFILNFWATGRKSVIICCRRPPGHLMERKLELQLCLHDSSMNFKDAVGVWHFPCCLIDSSNACRWVCLSHWAASRQGMVRKVDTGVKAVNCTTGCLVFARDSTVASKPCCGSEVLPFCRVQCDSFTCWSCEQKASHYVWVVECACVVVLQTGNEMTVEIWSLKLLHAALCMNHLSPKRKIWSFGCSHLCQDVHYSGCMLLQHLRCL